MPTSHLAYRPDIDGLRAVAVLSVLFFHAGLPPFFGGFVGVDIFFVISGYLITGILLTDMERGRYSIAHFYERRIRRIFPALYATIAFTLIGATILFSAVDLQQLYDSIAWLAVFASNVYFLNNSGYFDAAAEQNAILQTWSLAIEEQFYVVFPIALAFLQHRVPRWTKWIVLAVAIASLLFSIAIVDRDARTAFFSTPGRIWELMTGALLALGLLPAVQGAAARNAAAAVGAAMIAGSIVLLTAETPFPGAYALPACLGTALVIWANTSGPTPIGAFLSTRPMVFVGLISYSLYLLHWPVLVFARYWLRDEFGLPYALIALAIAFVASVACWRYIETPFRNRSLPLTRNALFGGALALIATLSLGGLLASRFYEGQLTNSELEMMAQRERSSRDACLIKDTQTLKDWPAASCSAAGADTIAIWGDSFAAHYFPALRKFAAENGRGLLLLSESSCPPIAGLVVPNRKGCDTFNREVLEKLKAEKPSLVILSADWMIYEKKKTVAEAMVDKYELLAKTIAELKSAGMHVLVIGPSPIFPAPVFRIAAADKGVADASAKASFSRKFDSFFREQEARGAIDYFPAYTVFCDAAVFCRYKSGADLLFWDEGHLTDTGGVFVIDRLSAKFPFLQKRAPD